MGGEEVIGQLQDFVRQLERQSYGWRAAHLHLSRLRARNRRDFHLRIVANEFEPLLGRHKSELFQLPDGDMVFAWNSEQKGDVEAVVLRLHYLFSDDPLLAGDDPDAEPRPGQEGAEEGDDAPSSRFCSWHDLESNFYDFYDLVDELAAAPSARPAKSAPGRPLDPATLARTEHALAGLDVSDLIRRQPVCAVIGDQPPLPVFDEVHVAVGEMAKRLAPGVDLTGEPWLFQRLAESLDRRLLQCLMTEAPEDRAISVNLRLATLHSGDFLRFDSQFRAGSKREMIIELQLVDIFAELGAYMFIRDYLKKRGYRILIDGLHHLHLPLISRKRLGADLIKVVWSPDLLDETSGSRIDDLRKAVGQAGVDRVVLCRCDSSRAVEFGHALGLRLFQGHYLDSRLRAQRAPAIGAARKALRGISA